MSKDRKRHIEKFKILGQNIRQFRKLNKLSQEELAYRISSARNYVGCIERAEKLPALSIIFDIADVLNCEAVDLFKNVKS